jgi:dsRNA-specific ribonuclease
VKRFFRDHFLSRHLDVSTLFDFRTPTVDLSRLCAREGFESPVARLISETGRLSRHPVFIVGVYSGNDKLGEGAGSSLDEARTRAAAAALKSWYLYRPVEVTVPSSTEGGLDTSKWRPNLVDVGEVIV